MKAIDSWLMRTITHPIRRTLRSYTSSVFDEMELSANHRQAQDETIKILTRAISRNNDKIDGLECLILKLTDTVESLQEYVVDTNNETALRESQVLYGLNVDTDVELDLRLDCIDERFDAIREELDICDDRFDDLEADPDEDIIKDILESYTFSVNID